VEIKQEGCEIKDESSRPGFAGTRKFMPYDLVSSLKRQSKDWRFSLGRPDQ
jgi:hypothetical protein